MIKNLFAGMMWPGLNQVCHAGRAWAWPVTGMTDACGACTCGLLLCRVRMGMSSSVTDPADVTLNRASGRTQYSGESLSIDLSVCVSVRRKV